ncbi:MAG: hypothetical protein IJW49_05895 [Clostridia bacterium]|nr:hypothetical protein [Clostridia bacterium]
MTKKTRAGRSILCLFLILCTLFPTGCVNLQLADQVPNENEETKPPKEELQGELLPSPDVLLYGKTIASGTVLYAYEQLEESIARTIPASTIYFDREKQVTEEDLKTAARLFTSDRPDCFWFQKNYTFTTIENIVIECQPTYNFTGDKLEAAREELETAVDSFLTALPEGQEPYQIALSLHDALAKHVKYEKVGYHQTAYGALVDEKAVCAGYAAAYQLLLQRAGIPSYTVTGTAIDPSDALSTEPVAHAWNAVWLSDGECVFTDVTWDDALDYTYHYYFNLSFEEMEQDHVTDTAYFEPISCNHNTYSYFDRTLSVNVDDTATASRLAPLFRKRVDAPGYEAVLYYTGKADFSNWFRPLASSLLWHIKHGTGNASCTSRWISKGHEYYVVLIPN